LILIIYNIFSIKLYVTVSLILQSTVAQIIIHHHLVTSHVHFSMGPCMRILAVQMCVRNNAPLMPSNW